MRDPSALSLPARERAIAGLAALLTEAPWTIGADELRGVADAGVSDEGVVQVVTIAAVFNHLTRVADATGVEADYATPLPRFVVDASREAVPRPPREARTSCPTSRFTMARRPATRAAFSTWADYVRTPSRALSARDRAVLGTSVALELCDPAGTASWGDARPASEREVALASYARTLTLTPWRVGGADLEPLRAQGLDDRGLLDVIAVVGTQNMASRIALALG